MKNMEIDENFLREVGLSAMPEEQKKAFLDYVEEELEMRIGEKLSDGVPPEELKKFEEMDDIDALLWLKEHKPNFSEVVDQTINELKLEITSNRDKILEA